MRRIVFLVFLVPVAFSSAQYTDPNDLPVFSTLQSCVRLLFSDTGFLEYINIDCGNWFCVCDHYSDAIYTLSTLAISSCSTSPQDVMAATSVLNSFCAQITPTTSQSSYVPVGVTDPSQWPNFYNLRICVQYLFSDTGEELLSNVNCLNWLCVCDDSGAASILSTMAIAACTDSQDQSVATSLFSAFCSQITLKDIAPTTAGQISTSQTEGIVITSKFAWSDL